MKKLIKRQKGGFLAFLPGATFDKDGNYLGNSIFGDYKNKMGSFGGGKMDGSGAGGRFTLTPRYSNMTFNEAFDAATEANEPYFWYGEKLYNTNKELNPIREINNRYVGNSKERSKLKANDSYDYQIGPIKIQGLSNIPIIQKSYNKTK